MITEDYVSFETAKLLKEKGFDEACDKKYFGDDCSGPSYIRDSWEEGGDVCPMSNDDLDDGSKYADISAPTLQMAMKWLREIHEICIELLFHPNKQDWGWYFQLLAINNIKKCFCGYGPSKTYSSYEEACEAAIKYCLINLI